MTDRHVFAGSGAPPGHEPAPARDSGVLRRPRRRRSLAVGALVGFAIVVRLALLAVSDPEIAAHLHIGSAYPNCDTAQISTPEGREGTCAVRVRFGRSMISTVVNRDHVLHMPGYDARLLSAVGIPTRVTNVAPDNARYPGARGLLMSYRVRVRNTTGAPLQFDADGRSIDLLYPVSRTSHEQFLVPQLVHADDAPGAPPGHAQPIAPYATATGWVSFVVPLAAATLLDKRPADLEFYRPGRPDRAFNGQLRLWK